MMISNPSKKRTCFQSAAEKVANKRTGQDQKRTRNQIQIKKNRNNYNKSLKRRAVINQKAKQDSDL